MDAFLSDLWNCKLDLGYNAKIAAYWMTATGPMVVPDWHCQCQKWSTLQCTDPKLFCLLRYKIAARLQCDNPSQF